MWVCYWGPIPLLLAWLDDCLPLPFWPSFTPPTSHCTLRRLQLWLTRWSSKCTTWDNQRGVDLGDGTSHAWDSGKQSATGSQTNEAPGSQASENKNTNKPLERRKQRFPPRIQWGLGGSVQSNKNAVGKTVGINWRFFNLIELNIISIRLSRGDFYMM